MKILFMGTPDFALFSLRALVEAGEKVAAVVTQPDKPKGRGMTLTPPPVKVYAAAHGIPVYQPTTLKGGAFTDTLREINPDLIAVVAYGKILPRDILEYPQYGCINIHGSLLPKYRGAAPMQRAIMDGETVTGVTSMYMAEGLDTGDMLLTEEIALAPNDDFACVHDKLGAAGSRVLLRTVEAARRGALRPIPQNDADATYAAKIEKTECLLDFSCNAAYLHNKIRGLSPFPLAYTTLPSGKLLKILRAHPADATVCAPAGTVIAADKNGITIACGVGTLVIEVATPEGKKPQHAADLVNGRQITVGDKLG